MLSVHIHRFYPNVRNKRKPKIIKKGRKTEHQNLIKKKNEYQKL